MVEYTTRAEFQRFAQELQINEQISVRKRAEEASVQNATFLSHSSQDKELVVGAIRVLEAEGATVYIDKKDSSLPPYTSKETAAGLKRRIHQSRTFVLLASKNSKDSRWVPWELGLADEAKGLDRVAVFPAVEERHDTAWTNWEYLGLYDRIVWGTMKGEQKATWLVLDERANTASKLSAWLRK